MTARSVEERLSAEVATAEGNLRFQGQLCYIMHAPEGKPTQNSRESRTLRFFFFIVNTPALILNIGVPLRPLLRSTVTDKKRGPVVVVADAL